VQAAIITAFGQPEQLRLTELPDPRPGPGQVRIAVRAAGVNPVDGGNRADGGWAGLQLPCILGYERCRDHRQGWPGGGRPGTR
jgi:NADPH:quinone reductase